jgi:hypothetical protein
MRNAHWVRYALLGAMLLPLSYAFGVSRNSSANSDNVTSAQELGSRNQVLLALCSTEVKATAAKASNSTDGTSIFLDQTREAVGADGDAPQLSMQAVREERLQTLNDLHQQRIATIAAIRRERLAAAADLRRERQAVLAALRGDDAAFVNDLRTISEKEIQDLDATCRALIDHFFTRALELVLLTLILCFLVAWTLIWRFAKPSQPW